MDDAARCPCGTGETYGACCGPLHAGGRAGTALQLMRSRYSAFAVGDEAHLRRTWHPATVPDGVLVDPSTSWRSLEVLGRVRGGLGDDEGTVTFRAHARAHGRRQVVAETSRFARADGSWVYVGPA